MEIDDDADGVVGERAVGGEEAAALARLVEGAQLVLQAGFSDLEAEVFAGDVFERMGLVQDCQVVLGQVVDTGHAQGEIAEEKGVVDDQDVARLHAALGGLPEALFVEGTSLAKAVTVLSADLVPDVRLGERGEIGERALGGVGGPVLDHPEGIELALVVEEIALAAAGLLQTALAEVVVAALDQDGGELIGQDRAKQRDVLVDELFLKRDRMGGDDDPLFVLDGEMDGGDEVGE